MTWLDLTWFGIVQCYWSVKCILVIRVSAHDILIFDRFSVVFVRFPDNNQQSDVCYSSKCGIHSIRTVIAKWSKAQISNLMLVRSSLLISRSFLNSAHTYISYSTILLISCSMFLCVFWFRIFQTNPYKLQTIRCAIKHLH